MQALLTFAWRAIPDKQLALGGERLGAQRVRQALQAHGRR